MSNPSLTLASLIVDQALAKGREGEVAPMTVIVLDPGAVAIALNREDGASNLRGRIAETKEAACLGMGFEGQDWFDEPGPPPAFYSAVGQVAMGSFLPALDGVLVRGLDGELLGAVGISGYTAENDEICAVAGVTAAGLHADIGA